MYSSSDTIRGIVVVADCCSHERNTDFTSSSLAPSDCQRKGRNSDDVLRPELHTYFNASSRQWSDGHRAQVWDLPLQYNEYGAAWRKSHTSGEVLNAPFFYAQWYTEHNSAHLITIPTLFSPASCEANSAGREQAPLLPAWSCVCTCVAALWPTHYHQQSKRRPSLPNWMVERPCKKMPFHLLPRMQMCCLLPP